MPYVDDVECESCGTRLECPECDPDSWKPLPPKIEVVTEAKQRAYWQWVADQIHAYNSVVRGHRTGGCHEAK